MPDSKKLDITQDDFDNAVKEVSLMCAIDDIEMLQRLKKKLLSLKTSVHNAHESIASIEMRVKVWEEVANRTITDLKRNPYILDNTTSKNILELNDALNKIADDLLKNEKNK